MSRRISQTQKLSILAVIILAGYGVPLLKAWKTAHDLKSDPKLLSGYIQEKAAAETGAAPVREWLGRHLAHFPLEETFPLLLDYMDDHRPGVRYLCADWITRYYLHPIETRETPLEPWMESARDQAWGTVLDYLNEPRVPAIYRFNLLTKYPWLADNPRGEAAGELLRRQASLFPQPMEEWQVMATVILLDYDVDYSRLAPLATEPHDANALFPSPRHPDLKRPAPNRPEDKGGVDVP